LLLFLKLGSIQKFHFAYSWELSSDFLIFRQPTHGTHHRRSAAAAVVVHRALRVFDVPKMGSGLDTYGLWVLRPKATWVTPSLRWTGGMKLFFREKMAAAPPQAKLNFNELKWKERTSYEQ